MAFEDSNEDLNSERRQRAKGYDVKVYTRRHGKKLTKDCSYKSKIATVGENHAVINRFGRENEVFSSALATSDHIGVSDPSKHENIHGPSAASPVVARADVVEASLDEPVQHELPCSSQNGVDKEKPNQNLQRENDVDLHSEKPCNAQSGDAIVQEDGARVQSLSQIPTDNNEDDVMPLQGSTRDVQGDFPGHEYREYLSVANSGDFMRFNLGKRSSKDLSQKLENDLESIRSMFKMIETKELQLASCDIQLRNNEVSTNGNFITAEAEAPNTVDRMIFSRMNLEAGPILRQDGRPGELVRVNSDVGFPRSFDHRPYNRQLSVAVMETNNRPGEFVEKEKRTPKANQLYRNSEFLLGKDRLPPESNKRVKTSNGRKYSGDAERAFRFGLRVDKVRNKIFRSCRNLIQQLMKHKFSWVFNAPVDVHGLGLFDYYDIIKHPMDLGTIKERLSRSWYNSPREFADDVRLVFHNAMTYNPKGQDVHFMAEELLRIFEERWAVVEMEYNDYWKYQLHKDGGFPNLTSRKASSQPYYTPSSFSAPLPPPVTGYAPQQFDQRDQVAGVPRPRPHFGRTPVPKRPKAKDPNKRDMTQDEKQRLSKKLQDLPGEKLDAIVQIIKRRNTALSQHDDEIEVDIDSVDPETLWELDRFVSNYKKSLSKNKRRAELALGARSNPNQNATIAKSTPTIAGIQTETGAPGKSVKPSEEQKGGESSSTSDSGSSSSDSDSDSSSGDGSDAGDSPGT